jgi:hypothetical protein
VNRDAKNKEASMKTGRRVFLSGFAMALAGARTLFAGSQQRGVPSRPPRLPDAGYPGNPPGNFPPLPAPDPRAQLKENQKNLRKDADQLLQLAQELKDEAEKTEQTDVLSLSLVKKAEEVEKLARHIKDLAKAS